MDVEYRVSLTREERLSMFESALLAIGYWCDIENVKRSKLVDATVAEVWLSPSTRHQLVGWEHDSGRLLIDDWMMQLGLDKLCREPGRNGEFHIQNVVKGNDDAETADVLLQKALFGKIVFG